MSSDLPADTSEPTKVESFKPFTQKLQYVNKTSKELVFLDGQFLTYENLPLDYLKICGKILTRTVDGLFLKERLLGSINDRAVTWVSNEVMK